MAVDCTITNLTPVKGKIQETELTFTSEESIDQIKTTLGNLILEDLESVKNIRNVYRQYKLLETEKTGIKLFLIDRIGLYFEGNLKLTTFLSYTIDDYGLTYFLAMCLVTLAFLWNVYMIPLRWAFLHGTLIPTGNFTHTVNRIPNSPLYYAVDIIADLIYVLDIILVQSHKQYVSHAQGVKITDVKQTIKFYLRSYGFYLDVVSTIFPWVQEFQYFATNRYHPIFRLTRYLKFHRFNQLLLLIQQKLHYAQAFRQFRVLLQILIIAHTLGCVFFLYYIIQGERTDGIFAGFVVVESSSLHPLIFTFYWGFVIITNIHNQARPSESGQFIFMIVCHFIGSLHMAYVFAVFVSSLRVGNWHRNLFRVRSERARFVFTLYKDKSEVSQLRDEVTDYFEYGYENHIELHENTILNYFPQKLRINLAEECYNKILKKVYLFKGLSQSFFIRLLLLFENRVYLPREIVYRKGDIGNELFIITKGSVNLVEKGQNVGTLRQGQLFGYHEVFAEISRERFRAGNAETVGFTHLLVFHKRTIDRILDQLPKDERIIRKTVSEMDKVFRVQRMRAFQTIGPRFVETPRDATIKRLIKVFQRIQAASYIYRQLATEEESSEESICEDSNLVVRVNLLNTCDPNQYQQCSIENNDRKKPILRVTTYQDDFVEINRENTLRPATASYRKKGEIPERNYLSPELILTRANRGFVSNIKRNQIAPK